MSQSYNIVTVLQIYIHIVAFLFFLKFILMLELCGKTTSVIAEYTKAILEKVNTM